MKKFISFILFLFLLIPSAFSFNYPIKFYPFLGYVNFHDQIDLKDTILLGIGLNQKFDENLRLDLQGGFMPSEYVSKAINMPVYYGSLNGQYLLPKACCGVTPFLSAGLSVFSFDGQLDKGIEFGVGLLTLSNKNVEHKFEVKARYNPGDKQSDILAILSLGLTPINEAKPELVVEKQTEQVKEITKNEEIKQEIPTDLIVVIEEDKEPAVVKKITPIVVDQQKKKEIKQEASQSTKRTFVSNKKIIMDRFFYNSATIGVPGVEFVKNAATILKNDTKLKTVIVGYANSFEPNATNLSLKRAEEVKSELIKKYNISKNRISAKSGGSKSATNNNYLNRRVEISFYYEN